MLARPGLSQCHILQDTPTGRAQPAPHPRNGTKSHLGQQQCSPLPVLSNGPGKLHLKHKNIFKPRYSSTSFRGRSLSASSSNPDTHHNPVSPGSSSSPSWGDGDWQKQPILHPTGPELPAAPSQRFQHPSLFSNIVLPLQGLEAVLNIGLRCFCPLFILSFVCR